MFRSREGAQVAYDDSLRSRWCLGDRTDEREAFGWTNSGHLNGLVRYFPHDRQKRPGEGKVFRSFRSFSRHDNGIL